MKVATLNEPELSKALRSFGLTVGPVFLGIGVWPLLWYRVEPRVWALAIGALLVLCGWLMPSLLRPVYRGWMAIGHVLGWVNTNIILGLFFYGILTPIGIVARLCGNDFLHLKKASGADTYRVVRPARSATHVWHQF